MEYTSPRFFSAPITLLSLADFSGKARSGKLLTVDRTASFVNGEKVAEMENICYFLPTEEEFLKM